MKKKILAAAMLSMFAGSAFAVEDTDTQSVTVSVPEVALLDVNTGTDTVGFNCEATGAAAAGGLAGQEIECEAASGSVLAVPYAITANVAANGATKRLITAQTDVDLDDTWTLTASMVPVTGVGAHGGTAGGAKRLDNSASESLVTDITNIVGTGNITYALGATDSDKAMAFADHSGGITVTYTLGDDS